MLLRGCRVWDAVVSDDRTLCFCGVEPTGDRIASSQEKRFVAVWETGSGSGG